MNKRTLDDFFTCFIVSIIWFSNPIVSRTTAECDENLSTFLYKNDTIELYPFKGRINDFLTSTDHRYTIVRTTSSKLYLLKRTNSSTGSSYDFKNCLKIYGEIAFFIEFDQNRFLACSPTGGHLFYCWILAIQNDRLIDENRLPYNVDTDLRSCLISEIGNGPGNFLLACKPSKRASNSIVPYLNYFKLKELNDGGFEFRKYRQLMIDLDDEALGEIEIDLVYSFRIADELFVVKRERKGRNDSTWVTKLGRTCLNFGTYFEIPLTCADPKTGQSYGYARSAQFRSQLLYVSFNYYDNDRKTVDRSKGTVLCSVGQKQIKNIFRNLFIDCNSQLNSEARLMTYYYSSNVNSPINRTSAQCTKIAVRAYEGRYPLCRNDVNPYIEYTRTSLDTQFMHRFENEIITSLLLFSTSRNEEVILATGEEGRIHEIRDYERKSILNVRPTGPMKLSSFRSDPVDSVFISSGRLLIKYSLVEQRLNHTEGTIDTIDFTDVLTNETDATESTTTPNDAATDIQSRQNDLSSGDDLLLDEITLARREQNSGNEFLSELFENYLFQTIVVFIILIAILTICSVIFIACLVGFLRKRSSDKAKRLKQNEIPSHLDESEKPSLDEQNEKRNSDEKETKISNDQQVTVSNLIEMPGKSAQEQPD